MAWQGWNGCFVNLMWQEAMAGVSGNADFI